MQRKSMSNVVFLFHSLSCSTSEELENRKAKSYTPDLVRLNVRWKLRNNPMIIHDPSQDKKPQIP